jgi:hypothetical protein
VCWKLFCQPYQNYSKEKIKIEVKSINNDAWLLVNFMLSFSGLSPLLIGPKLIFFELTWHIRPQQRAHLLDSTQQKRAHPNQISSKKATNRPNKTFFGLYDQHQPTWIVLGSTQLQTSQIRFMTQTVCHNWHATSDATSDFVQHGKAAGTKLSRFVLTILHASLNSWCREIRSRH